MKIVNMAKLLRRQEQTPQEQNAPRIRPQVGAPSARSSSLLQLPAKLDHQITAIRLVHDNQDNEHPRYADSTGGRAVAIPSKGKE